MSTPGKETNTDRLAKMGLETEWDLILHKPLRYEDETCVSLVRHLVPGTKAVVEGEIVRAEMSRVGGGRQLFKAWMKDSEGNFLTLIWWHFYPQLTQQIKAGVPVRVFGEIRHGYQGLECTHPKVKSGRQALQPLPSTLTPVYSLTQGITQHWMRQRIDRAMLDADMTDFLPKALIEAHHWPSFKEAITHMHKPPKEVSLEEYTNPNHPVWQRLSFEELLAQQVLLRLERSKSMEDQTSAALIGDNRLVTPFLKGLPFTLTRAQQRVWGEVDHDLAKTRPMNRLVQGDVGCGKTMIAALAALRAIEAGYQVALMAPTEILAEQHFKKLVDYLLPLGIEPDWLVSRLKTKEKNEALARIASGETRLIIGTHALIQKEVNYHQLGLVIIDEQHRFGVEQRLALRQAGQGNFPHLLMMSATPIPRTLAMSYLADIDVSIIDELPPGRTPIVTKLLSMDKKAKVAQAIAMDIQQGRQAYWVCPLIEDSEALEDLASATETFNQLQAWLPQVKLALLTSQTPTPDKEAIMTAFTRGELELLISTTVIEVGVDVPNASIMVIENAERFGLAQLHQLRGRVGRGTQASTCLLLYGPNLSENGRHRLQAIHDNTDGFEIARIDLSLRGPGEFLGARQSGMPLLRFADLERDGDLLTLAQQEASRWIERDPTTAERFCSRWFRQAKAFLAA